MHTSGPWRIGEQRGIEDFVTHRHIEAGDDERAVCRMYPRNDNDLANARLISAAPDLLTALQGLFEHCVMVHKHWGDGNNTKEANAAISRAEAAIARAEGRTE